MVASKTRRYVDGVGRKGNLPHTAFPQCQNIVDHVDHSRGGGDVGHDALGRRDRRLGAAQFRRELVCILKHIRVRRTDGPVDGPAAAADAADNLAGMFPVAAVDVDQVFHLVEHPVAELPALVVVHRANQKDLLCDRGITMLIPVSFRGHQGLQPRFVFDERGYILGLQPKDGSIPLGQDLGLVFAQVRRDEVLPHQVLFLHHVAVTDNETDRPFQGVEQTVQVGRNVPAGAAGAQHDDPDRAALGKFHSAGPPLEASAASSGQRRLVDALVTRSIHAVGNSAPTLSRTRDGSMAWNTPPQEMRTEISG